MPNAVVEGLFLLACWAPPLAVAVCAGVLLVKRPSARESGATAHAAPLPH